MALFKTRHLFSIERNDARRLIKAKLKLPLMMSSYILLISVPALALSGVSSLPRASQFRGPHSSKKRALEAVDCCLRKFMYILIVTQASAKLG